MAKLGTANSEQTVDREEPNALTALPRRDDHMASQGDELNFQ
jgi:hypothetical protein